MTQTLSTTLTNTIATAVATTFNNGTLEIYAGTIGSTPEDTSGGTLLVTCPFPIVAFGTAVDGVIAMAGQWFGTIAVTGTAAWGRLCDYTNTLHIIVTVGTADANVILETTSLVENGVIQITSFTYTIPSN